MNKYKLEDYIPEEEQSMLVDPNPLDDVPSVKLDIDENGTMKIELSAFFHSKDNGKIPLLANNPALQEVVMKAIQIESQKAFRRAVHGVLGIPYGLPENKKTKTMTNETKLWQLRAGLITESEYQASMEELDTAPAIGNNAPGAPSDEDKSDPNVNALTKYLQPRQANLKPIDTIPELKQLLSKVVTMVQTLNKDALTDQEVTMAMRQLLAAYQQKMGQKK